MKVILTEIPDVKILEPKVFGDERGFFLPNAKIPDTTSQIFKEKVVTEAEKEAYRIREREYYVNGIMKRKGVTREVAEAEYDFF